MSYLNLKLYLIMIKLIRPTLKDSEDIMEMRKEFLEKDQINYIHGSADLQEYNNIGDWIHHVEDISNKETCPADSVDSDVYLALREDDNRIIGIAQLRHHINNYALSKWGGHIGYSVRPSHQFRSLQYQRSKLLQMEQFRCIAKFRINCLCNTRFQQSFQRREFRVLSRHLCCLRTARYG